MSSSDESGLSLLEYHTLLAVAREPMHGYAVRDAVRAESGGALTPRAGTLYRVIARLLSDELVEEVDEPADAEPHPGRPRRYYEITTDGRSALARKARHLEAAAALAIERLEAGRS